MSTGVTVDFNANLARFTSGIDKAINDLNRFQSNADRISGNITKAFGALGVGLSVGGFAAFIKSSIDVQDHLLDLSKTTRLTVEQLSGLASAAKKSGSDLDGTAKSINKLAVEMGKDGEKFKALGISAKDPLEAFGQLADVMNAIDDPQKRAAVGAVALGKGWESAAPLLAEGSKAIKEMIDRGTALSKVTTESAKRADEFNDKWEDLKTIAGGWGVAIADPIVAGILKIQNALSLEIDKKPGSIAHFLGQRSQGYSGPKDALGLPTLAPTPVAAAPVKPSAAAVKKFIGGEGGKTDLQRMIELGQKNLAGSIDSEEEMRILAEKRAMQGTREEFAALQRMLKVGEQNELAAYYDTAGEETMRLVAEQRELQDAIKSNSGMAKDLGLTFASAAEDAIMKWESVGAVLKGLGNDVARIFLRKTVTEPFGDAVTGFIKGDGKSGSSLTDRVKGLFGFASGGAFTVGGAGGTDSQLVAFKATPGEEVTVRTPAQQGGGGSSIVIHQTINVDSRSDQASIMQAMVAAKNAAIGSIHDSMRRGGSFA
jgi:hypothetical protein